MEKITPTTAHLQSRDLILPATGQNESRLEDKTRADNANGQVWYSLRCNANIWSEPERCSAEMLVSNAWA